MEFLKKNLDNRYNMNMLLLGRRVSTQYRLILYEWAGKIHLFLWNMNARAGDESASSWQAASPLHQDPVDIVDYKDNLKIKQSQQTQNICITFVQRRPNVFDVGPTLYKCYTNVLCLPGYSLGHLSQKVVNIRTRIATEAFLFFWDPQHIHNNQKKSQPRKKS